MEATNYTAINLRPTDKEEQRLFWKFRVDDVMDLFVYICYVQTIWLLAYFLSLINEFNYTNQVMFGLGFILAAYHWLVYCFRFRLKDNLIWIIFVLYISNQILTALASELIYRASADKELSDLIIYRISNDMVAYTCFLAANLVCSFAFGAIFMVNIVIVAFAHDHPERKALFSNRVALVIVSNFMIYVLLRRELRRFF